MVRESVLANYSNKAYNTAYTLISVAIDENIDLDGVYFVLRREPNVLQKLLSARSKEDSENDKDNNDKTNDRRKDKDGNDNSMASTIKRKRTRK